jgi:hypothetical protein
MKTTDSRLWHYLSVEDILDQLETGLEKGLTI